MDIMGFFKEWYISKCDGEWEHMHGIKISNIDNPGWQIEITGEDKKIPFTIDQAVGEDSWMVINASEDKFTGYCSAENLLMVLEHAKKWIINAC